MGLTSTLFFHLTCGSRFAADTRNRCLEIRGEGAELLNFAIFMPRPVTLDEIEGAHQLADSLQQAARDLRATLPRRKQALAPALERVDA